MIGSDRTIDSENISKEVIGILQTVGGHDSENMAKKKRGGNKSESMTGEEVTEGETSDSAIITSKEVIGISHSRRE